MRKELSSLIAICLCALSVTGAQARSLGPDSENLVTVGEDETGATVALVQPLTTTDLKAKLEEATESLKAQPHADAKTVILAALDPQTSDLQILRMEKDRFLTKDATLSVTSQSGRQFQVTVIRANGVNTAVRVKDVATGRELMPLTIEFPIEKGGTVTEVAYYNSAHPAILSPQVTTAGEAYVSDMLDHAADDLATRGIHIAPDIVDIAEHLCVVEHTDHKRFMTENHSALLPEIVSLYALNQGDTFRYSVSTAGAGGMIQMIPRTYEGIRQQHSAIPLQSDFVTGMRDHANALEAMLLYMNDTWNKLEESSEVQDALRNGIATKPELLAAGYNSNPVRLPTYLKNGGTNWRTLIPAETQMYLAIYGEVDRTIKFDNSRLGDSASVETQDNPVPTNEGLLGWLQLVITDSRGLLTRVL